MSTPSERSRTGELAWTSVGQFVDCAYAAIGDPRLAGDGAWRAVADVGGLPFLKVRRSGYGMIYGKAQCDFPPIELGYLAGVAVALKMEFTDDVGDLEAAADGGWHTLGELRIGGKGAVVLDANKSDAAWRQDVDLPAGWYLAQTYQWGDDHLGIRLLARDTDLA